MKILKHRINENAVLELQPNDKVSIAKGHEMEIDQVIVNLISNACDSIKEKKNLLGDDYTGKITLKTYSRQIELPPRRKPGIRENRPLCRTPSIG